MSRESIDANTPRTWLEQGEPVTVLDTRPEDERAEWLIPGSVPANIYEALKAKDPDALRSVDISENRPVVTRRPRRTRRRRQPRCAAG